MPLLPTTNVSLNDIHVEVGGTSGTQVSLNDVDVRAISPVNATYAPSGISQTSETSISMGLFRGAGVNLVTLRGTSGSPITYFDDSQSFGVSFGTASAGLRFQTDGDLVKYSNSTQVDTTEWYNGATIVGSYWVKATNSGVPSVNGDGYGFTSANIGDALNTWHSLSSERTFYCIAQCTNTLGTASIEKTLKVEISSDSSGNTVLATGYYRVRARSTFGF